MLLVINSTCKAIEQKNEKCWVGGGGGCGWGGGLFGWVWVGVGGGLGNNVNSEKSQKYSQTYTTLTDYNVLVVFENVYVTWHRKGGRCHFLTFSPLMLTPLTLLLR